MSYKNYTDSNRLPANYTMVNPKNASSEDASIKSPHLEQRTTVLSALARIIAKAYLGKTAADKNGPLEITLPDSQSYSVSDISNGDG